MNPLKYFLQLIGVDSGTGRPTLEVVSDSGRQSAYGTTSGTITSPTALATFSLPAGGVVYILGASVANEGTSGSATFEVEAGGAPLYPLYLPAPGTYTLPPAELRNPYLVVANSTANAITVGVYVTSSTASNVYEASLQYEFPPSSFWPSV